MSNDPTRRDFLARTAALAAAGGLGALVPESALAAAEESTPIDRALRRPSLASSDPVRIGVIGTGGMGTEHCNAILRLVNAERTAAHIVALCDVCVPRLSEAAQAVVASQQRGVEIELYTDYRKLLADPSIHAVLIASPEHWHARMAEDAILAGKDVYVEKPMTYDLRDALRLRHVVQANPDARVVVGTQHVMNPSYPAARKLIAEGAIGTPVFSQTSYCRNSKEGEWLYYEIDEAWEPGVNLDWRAWTGPLGRQPWDPAVYARWRRYRRYSTGIIGDLLVHRMAPLMQTLDAGWPVRVVAAGGHLVD
ncbi:MAG: Gfo/Idh/MocA family protein, partial [Longimicrobiales bacterium]